MTGYLFFLILAFLSPNCKKRKKEKDIVTLPKFQKHLFVGYITSPLIIVEVKVHQISALSKQFVNKKSLNNNKLRILYLMKWS